MGVLADFFLDLLFGVDARLRQRQAEIDAAKAEQLRRARAHLLEELAAADRLRAASSKAAP